MPEVRTVPLRGAMECFYGAPWSPDERRAVILESARWGMNCFVYGPSGDTHTGTDWRAPYSPAELAEFGRLASAAADVGVSLCWRISASSPLDPKRGILFSDPRQRRELLDRVDDVVSAGFRYVLLTFDDVENGLFHAADRAAFAGSANPVATAHALMATELARHLSATPAELAVCPTLYWGPGTHDYLHVLEAELPADVPLCWTGARVSSRLIAARAAADRRGGRPIWLWDNYPVNDWDGMDATMFAPAQRRLFLDPLVGRAPELTGEIDGYFVNCGAAARAGLPAIVTAAQWATQAETYEADRAIRDAVDTYDDAAGSLRFLRTAACSTPLGSRAPHPLAVRAWAFLGASADERAAAGPDLAGELTAAAECADTAVHSSAPVVRSARWYAEELAVQLRAAERAVALLTAEAVGDDEAMAGCAQWLADRRQQLDGLMRTAVLDGGLLPLIETGRGLAGPPVPPHDV